MYSCVVVYFFPVVWFVTQNIFVGAILLQSAIGYCVSHAHPFPQESCGSEPGCPNS